MRRYVSPYETSPRQEKGPLKRGWRIFALAFFFFNFFADFFFYYSFSSAGSFDRELVAMVLPKS